MSLCSNCERWIVHRARRRDNIILTIIFFWKTKFAGSLELNQGGVNSYCNFPIRILLISKKYMYHLLKILFDYVFFEKLLKKKNECITIRQCMATWGPLKHLLSVNYCRSWESCISLHGSVPICSQETQIHGMIKFLDFLHFDAQNVTNRKKYLTFRSLVG